MGCDCATVCPTARHCAVMEILSPFPGEDRCVAICDPDPQPLALPPLPLDAEVHVETRNMPLSSLGEFLNNFCVEEVLIPARLASRVVELKETNTTLGAVLEGAGLVVSPPAASPGRTPR